MLWQIKILERLEGFTIISNLNVLRIEFNEEYIFLSQGQGIITNEFSIYIKTMWRFPTHRKYLMHVFIDTGTTTSVTY